MKIKFILGLFLFSITLFGQESEKKIGNSNPTVSLYILGTIQDGGSPHIGCSKACCAALFNISDDRRKVVSVGLVDHQMKQSFLFEATPDFPKQMNQLKAYSKTETETPNGIFLTHAHIGHYTGLMYLGKEALGATAVPVYAMPKMKLFLENNGPWSQLVNNQNIRIKGIQNEQAIQLTKNIKVIPFLVPHRDEYSETVGYKIIGPNKSILFIPDIDKWEKWNKSISEEIYKVDYAFIDATFYDGKEINNRDISEIPHPFVIESMNLFDSLSAMEKEKIYFIHFNHTNPLLNIESKEAKEVINKGYRIAKINTSKEL